MKKEENSIQKALQQNIDTLKVIAKKKNLENEAQEFFKEFIINSKSVEKAVQKKIKNKWEQNANAKVASKERHDLYGNLTKINFGIEYIKMTYVKDFSKKEIQMLQSIIKNNKKIYSTLKTIFDKTKTYLLLIVEDESSLQMIFSKVLDDKRYQLIFADNGEDAIKESTNHLPDLIILDAILPKMSGEEVIENLVNTPKTSSIPIIVFSNKDQVVLDKLKKFPNVKEACMKVEIDIVMLKNIIQKHLA